MSDLLTQNLLQQLNSRPVTGEHLELLGKKAAAQWTDGRCNTLNEAVVETVKEAGLSPEQVKRVVEFTNTAAYLTEFKKEGAPHKYVDFGSSGPANYAVVLQDLNDGGGGSVFDPGNGHYTQPPRDSIKTSSVQEEDAFDGLFKVAEFEYPEENPLGDVLDLRDKLAAHYDNHTATLNGLEGMLYDLKDRLFFQVKQAAMSGHGLGEIIEVWSPIAPDEYIKVAFDMISDRLLENEVFSSPEDMAYSFQKTSGYRVVNPQHPLVLDFQDFCETISKLASVREEREEIAVGIGQLTTFLKTADKGIIHHGLKAVKGFAGHARDAGEHAGEVMLGKGKGKLVGTAAHMAGYAAPVVGAGLAANEAYRRTLKYNPTYHSAKNTLLTAVPGTQEYQQKDYELQAGGGGYQQY